MYTAELMPPETNQQIGWRLHWGEEFVDALNSTSGPVVEIVNLATIKGISKDSEEGRKRIAELFGQVFSYAFIPETGGERKAEELNLVTICNELGISEDDARKLLAILVVEDQVKTNIRSTWEDLLAEQVK